MWKIRVSWEEVDNFNDRAISMGHMLIVQSRRSCSQKLHVCYKLKIHWLKMTEEGKSLCVADHRMANSPICGAARGKKASTILG